MPSINHVALVKFKPGTAEGQIRSFFEGVGRMRQVVPGITAYSWGTNNSPEGLSQGYTHGFVLTFVDADAREVYLAHAAHKRIVEETIPHVEAVVVVDYAF